MELRAGIRGHAGLGYLELPPPFWRDGFRATAGRACFGGVAVPGIRAHHEARRDFGTLGANYPTGVGQRSLSPPLETGDIRRHIASDCQEVTLRLSVIAVQLPNIRATFLSRFNFKLAV